MFRQGPDFHFEIAVIRDKRGRDNESQLYLLNKKNSVEPDQTTPFIYLFIYFSRRCVRSL